MLGQDEALWGRQPGRVVATGLSEDRREHVARLRRYLCYYLRLLGRTREVETLLAAVAYLARGPQGYPRLQDILRCRALATAGETDLTVPTDVEHLPIPVAQYKSFSRA